MTKNITEEEIKSFGWKLGHRHSRTEYYGDGNCKEYLLHISYYYYSEETNDEVESNIDDEEKEFAYYLRLATMSDSNKIMILSNTGSLYLDNSREEIIFQGKIKKLEDLQAIMKLFGTFTFKKQ